MNINSTPKMKVLEKCPSAKAFVNIIGTWTVMLNRNEPGSCVIGKTAALAWKNAYEWLMEPAENDKRYRNISKRKLRIIEKIVNNTYHQKTQKESRNILHRAIG